MLRNNSVHPYTTINEFYAKYILSVTNFEKKIGCPFSEIPGRDLKDHWKASTPWIQGGKLNVHKTFRRRPE